MGMHFTFEGGIMRGVKGTASPPSPLKKNRGREPQGRRTYPLLPLPLPLILGGQASPPPTTSTFLAAILFL